MHGVRSNTEGRVGAPSKAGTGCPTVLRTTQFASTIDVINLIRGVLYAALVWMFAFQCFDMIRMLITLHMPQCASSYGQEAVATGRRDHRRLGENVTMPRQIRTELLHR